MERPASRREVTDQPIADSAYECVDCENIQDSNEECESCSGDTLLAVRLFDCPNGVTAEDWRLNRTDGCSDDAHDWKSGKHIRNDD